MRRLEGKVALISGGAEGIGAAVARLFVAEGGSVMLGDIQRGKAQALASELGVKAAAVTLDVRDSAQWDAAVAATTDIDGISEPGNVAEMERDVWERSLAINLTSTFNGCRAALPAIAASGAPGATLNRVMALEFAAAGWPVRVNTVHPGAIRTPMFERYLAGFANREAGEAAFAASHPLGRVGEAEEVAQAFLFLASDEASFTSGADLTVDGAGSIRS